MIINGRRIQLLSSCSAAEDAGRVWAIQFCSALATSDRESARLHPIQADLIIR